MPWIKYIIKLFMTSSMECAYKIMTICGQGDHLWPPSLVWGTFTIILATDGLVGRPAAGDHAWMI